MPNTPSSIVWTSLPILTFIFPIIGHVGITDSKGVVHDFAGSRIISTGQKLALGGAPIREVELSFDSSNPHLELDEAIANATEVFQSRNHNLVTNNCHHYVCLILNELNYKGKSNWTPVTLVKLIWFNKNVRSKWCKESRLKGLARIFVSASLWMICLIWLALSNCY